MIEIIPAIDIIDGKCVRLAQGDFSRVKEYSSDPLETAKGFEGSGLKRLHLVDLDGARTGSPTNLRVLESIANNTQLVIDFSGGLRTERQIQQVFNAGAALACVGSIAVTDPDNFFALVERYGPQKILLAADARDGKVAVNGWQVDTELDLISFLRGYVDRGGQNALVTDISRDGILEGASVDLYERVRQQVPELNLIASGGVGSLSDVDALEEVGCSGVIIGKAIYEGLIGLDDLARR